MNAVPLADFEPGSPAWVSKMTASKVAAVLGLSPWESRFSLWHRMAGLIDAKPETDQTRRGHYLESAVGEWFADQHPELLVLPGKAYMHRERTWQASTPDFLVRPKGELIPDSVLEVKTTAVDDEWGEAGTDQIPPYYRAQVMWQLDTLGLPVGHVAVLLPRLEFREYRIDYNEAEAAYIRAEARAFLDSLPGGPAEQRPDLDAHSQSCAAVQQLHPEIDGSDFHVPGHVAREYTQAVKGLRAAKARHDLARVQLADLMGDAKRARFDDKTIADRRAKNGGTPYLQAASRLPEIPEEIA
jgi:putative phage-type endonuclease